jgi:hypothetical protein
MSDVSGSSPIYNALPSATQAGKSPSSDARATVISTPDGLAQIAKDWIDAAVLRQTADDLFLLETAKGTISIRYHGDQAMTPGERLQIRLDDSNLLIRPSDPGKDFATNLAGRVLTTPETTRTDAGAVKFSNAIRETLLAMPVVEPIRTGLFAPQANLRPVMSMLPQVGSFTFILTAAMFPQAVRSGALSEALAAIQEKPPAPSNPLVRQVQETINSNPPKMDGSEGWLGWQMPLYDNGEVRPSKWLAKQNEPEKERRFGQLIVALQYSHLGPMQIYCMTDHSEAEVTIISLHELPTALRDAIRTTVAQMATRLTMETRTTFLTGEEFFFPVTD